MNSSLLRAFFGVVLCAGATLVSTSAVAQDSCADYILCLCDFAEQNSDEDPNAAISCQQTRQLYAALTTPESEQVCRESFDAIKRMYRQMAPIYASQGIVVPGSCR